VSPPLLETLTRALKKPGSPQVSDERIILLGKPGDLESRYRSIETMFDSRPVQRSTAGDEQDTAYLCYSSGTTGRAKGVETSHHNITSQLQALKLVYQPLKAGRDVILGILPFSHIYGESFGANGQSAGDLVAYPCRSDCCSAPAPYCGLPSGCLAAFRRSAGLGSHTAIPYHVGSRCPANPARLVALETNL
jgi:hypothetical protein